MGAVWGTTGGVGIPLLFAIAIVAVRAYMTAKTYRTATRSERSSLAASP